MKAKSILLMLIALPFLMSCNNEDDVNTIFCSGTWHLLNMYTTSEWNKENITDSKPVYSPTNGLAELQGFTILFKQDGSFAAGANGVSLSGTWTADGKSRKITISYTGQATGSTLAKVYFEALKNGAYYRGTDKVLQIAPQEKNTFMQFKHNN